MRYVILIILTIGLSISTYAQTRLKFTVKDIKTKEVLQFCNISVQGQSRGGITNADGLIQITVKEDDQLTFSYLGYQNKTLQAKTLIGKSVVFLKKKSYTLSEVTVVSDNDYLYDILNKCRKHINRNRLERVSKAYYGVETESKGKPIEFLECFYNGRLKGISIKELIYKNGRAGLSTMDSNYFHSFNTAKAISKIELTVKNDFYPKIPLQLSKMVMKKYFNLRMVGMDSALYHIAFKPKVNNNECFTGEVWIERKTFNILKINLSVKETSIHPFYPMHDFDKISAVSFNISNTYKTNAMDNWLDHTSFDYSFVYHSVRDSTIGTAFKTHGRVLDRKITSKGIVLFYDYKQPFIIPYFEYPDNLYYGDYYKMKFIPYNKVFWRVNNPLSLTEEQQSKMSFFSKTGELVNYRSCDYGRDYLEVKKGVSDSLRFLQFDYLEWSPEMRIHLIPNTENTKVYPPEKINASIQSDLYQLVVQILLDVTRANDTLYCSSYTMFDPHQTIYHLPEQPYTRAFMNIYFDLCEIERRKMQKELDARLYTQEEIDAIYQRTLQNIELQTQAYLKDVKLGENIISLKKWNQYVLEKLNIDNLKMIRETDKVNR